MKLQNFKTALSTFARVETSPLQLSPALTLHVLSIDGGNMQYIARQKEFVRLNPKHQIVTDNEQFRNDLFSRTLTDDVRSYLASVVIVGWDLKDDEGNDQPHSAAECLELLNLPDSIGGSIATAVIDHALNTALYTVDWEKVVTKNS